MLIKKATDIKSSEITDKGIYMNRRKFLMAAPAFLASITTGSIFPPVAHAGVKLNGVGKSPLSTDEASNSFKDITTYNNFYEFAQISMHLHVTQKISSPARGQ